VEVKVTVMNMAKKKKCDFDKEELRTLGQRRELEEHYDVE